MRLNQRSSAASPRVADFKSESLADLDRNRWTASNRNRRPPSNRNQWPTWPGISTLVATDRLGRIQSAEPVQAETLEDATDGRRRDADLDGDLLARHALPAQGLDPVDGRLRRRRTQAMGPGTAVTQSFPPALPGAPEPFEDRARANASGYCGGLRRLPTQNHSDQMLSTQRGQAGILVDVHSALQGSLKSRNLSFLGLSRMDNL